MSFQPPIPRHRPPAPDPTPASAAQISRQPQVKVKGVILGFLIWIRYLPDSDATACATSCRADPDCVASVFGSTCIHKARDRQLQPYGSWISFFVALSTRNTRNLQNVPSRNQMLPHRSPELGSLSTTRPRRPRCVIAVSEV